MRRYRRLSTRGIINNTHDWSREHDQPLSTIDLLGRIVAVSLKTRRIVAHN